MMIRKKQAKRVASRSMPVARLTPAMHMLKFPVEFPQLVASVYPDWVVPMLKQADWRGAKYVGDRVLAAREMNLIHPLVGVSPALADTKIWFTLGTSSSNPDRDRIFWTRPTTDEFALCSSQVPVLVPWDVPFFKELADWHAKATELWEQICRAELDWATLMSLRMNEDEMAYVLPKLANVLGYDRHVGNPTTNAVRFKSLIAVKIPPERITHMIEMVAAASMMPADKPFDAGIPSMLYGRGLV